MASIIDLVNSFDIYSTEFETLVHDLVIKNNDIPFDSQEVNIIQNAIITSVNSNLNQASTRYNGMLMLDRILPMCSKDVLLKYGILWIVKATEILRNADVTSRELILACKVLGFLVEHCKNIPELHKQISMQNVKHLIKALNDLQKGAKCGAVYYLIAVLLHHYPEVCEQSQVSIRKMILLQIDSTQENLVNASAKCYVLLAKATERPFQIKSIYTAWTYNEALLCNSLHTIMDELFSGLIELESVDIGDRLELPVIFEENVMQYYNEQKQRFSNLCTYLSAMLCGYGEKNSVVPHDILGVLCRGLRIVPLNLKNKNSFKEQMLYMILPKLHISLLTVLDAFVNGFAQELVPFGGTILKLFQQTLQWTSTVLENQVTFSNSKTFKSVRIHAYKCLSSWLRNTNSLSGIETIADECVTFILKDIVPERDRISLIVQKSQNLSKRAMKRFKDSQYENSSILKTGETSAKNMNLPLNADLCREALVTLQNIFFSGSVLLKRTFYENVQNIVIPLLYDFYLGPSKQTFYKDHDECRLELFKVLRALQMNPHPKLAFPTQYYLEISHKAHIYDVDLSVKQEAKLALTELEKIIHPAAPTLQLPREQEPDNGLVSEIQAEETTSIATNSTAASPSSKLNKRNRIEQELPEDTNMIPPVCKQPKITALEIVQSIEHGTAQNNIEENSTESIKVNDNIMDLDESRTDKDSNENSRKIREEERDKDYCSMEQSPRNIDEITNVNVESEVPECESVTRRVAVENHPQYDEAEDSEPDRIHKMTEKSPSEATQQKTVRDGWEDEGLDADTLDSLNLFRDEVKSNY